MDLAGPVAPGKALAIGTVLALDQACLDEQRHMPADRLLGHAMGPHRQLRIGRKDHEPLPRRKFTAGMKAQQRIDQRQPAIGQPELDPRRTEIAVKTPLVHTKIRIQTIRSNLAGKLTKRHPPLPKGRRYNSTIHVHRLFRRQKIHARRIDVEDS